ncbi:aminoglycoside phosphotransferase family protein [Streptomyces sp. HUAS MG91]|uniref:Aminoglycoside phosphotransferase family protein n=1 Tax=Streptomyces tabacisoli TaxID=3156398 RepID=A0AAU8IUX3_9ACTN
MGAVIAPIALRSSDVIDVRTRDLWDGFAAYARRHGTTLTGHHHSNHVVEPTEEMAAAVGLAAGARILVRTRKYDVRPVVTRTWSDERRVLEAVRRTTEYVPRPLARRQETVFHGFAEGVPLGSVCPAGKPVESVLIDALTDRLASLAAVPVADLPPRPGHWPRDGDSRGFLRALAHRADEQIRRSNWRDFGGLFVALGVPENALQRYARWVPVMTSRPFGLLHGDLHRDNVIVSGGSDVAPTCVDWELATYGDPLHDLAVHLVRMRYPEDQLAEVIRCWERAMRRVGPDAVAGLHQDLKHYVAFEHAQSVYPDVIRAVGALGGRFGQEQLEAAAQEIHRALTTAREPLGLRDAPDRKTIERLLYRRQVARGARHRDERFAVPVAWRQDLRVPLRDDFPDRAVRAALWAEGAASARHVFKGITHLATVVPVPRFGPVMIRRKLRAAQPLEPRFLNEHMVLRAIEDAGLPVKVPRVLALGVSDLDDRFTIHSYMGPSDIRQAPRHPEGGLLLGQMSGLVDQLCALAGVGTESLMPAMRRAGFDGEGFYPWLCGQLVVMVRELAAETRVLAGRLGLPDADTLGELLRTREVSHRPPVLLHGDLHPWNLVCSTRDFGLTLLDWEMAMVGDPLYDMVRHLHLTPTTREVRGRMSALWAQRMPARCTVDWEADARAYQGLEIVRSAYVDLDRMITRIGLGAPNVRRAVDSYTATLSKARNWLGMPAGPSTADRPYLALALSRTGR